MSIPSDETTWDPPEAARVYYRHKETSDRGYLVRREGRDAIRYDRGPGVDQHIFKLSDWNLESTATEKYSDMQIAQVCFEADKKLCWALGQLDLSKRDWLNDLTEKGRREWMMTGPPAKAVNKERIGLYKAIQAELRRK